jgi:hypothetical protein
VTDLNEPADQTLLVSGFHIRARSGPSPAIELHVQVMHSDTRQEWHQRLILMPMRAVELEALMTQTIDALGIERPEIIHEEGDFDG